MPSIKIQHQNRLNICSKICMHDESEVEKKTRRNAKKYERKFIYTLWMTTKLNTLTLTLAHSHNTDFSWNVYSHVLWCMCGIYSIEFVAVLFSCKSLRVFPVYFPFQSVTFSLVCMFFLNAQESFAWKLNGIRILIWRYGATSLTLMLSLS